MDVFGGGFLVFGVLGGAGLVFAGGGGQVSAAADTGVELTLLTRDAAHCEEILATLGHWGYVAERLS